MNAGPGWRGPLLLATLLATGAPALAQDAASPGATTADPAPVAAAEDEVDTRDVTWTLDIAAPAELRALLSRYLDLSRYLATPDTARVPRGELMRLRQAAPAQARALLETVGHFNAKVSTQARDDGQVIALRLLVEPGPLTRVAQARLEFEGPLSVSAEAGDADAAQLVARARLRWSLPADEVYTQDRWGSAKSQVLALLRAEGYATSAWSGTVAQVRTADDRATLFLVADSGPLYRFGAVEVSGLDHVDADTVRALQTFTAGEPLREQALLDYQDRLVKSALFDSVAIEMEPDPAQAGAMPVVVRVRERSLQQATLGLGVSDNTGPRVTLEHLHQRFLGFAWQAKSKFQLGRTDQQAAIDLTSHPLPGPYRNLLSASVSRTEASGLDVTSQRARLGRSKDDQRLERLYYLEWQRSLTRSLATGLRVDDTSAVSGNYQWIWRQLDHPLLPTQGLSLSLDTALGRSFATVQRGGVFGRVNGRLTHYTTLSQNWYSTSRLQIGQIFSAADVAVPYSLLFRTGGDDAVRGYAYQSLGPLDATGAAVGGRVAVVGSVELARPFLRSMPALWGATFVDVGNAAASWNTLNAALGYGVGLRWRSPVGALRMDLAYGQQVRKVRLHFSVGITF
ncbi:autotransporter assembly complex protein TamA [Sphaerotilus sp.]|uniref:autotransporter assembly complex protein TamA n=1 Tax=Sphaerotilus sp. TaxID=2093942 RepID=UPI002ACE2919|nr:BamA/TamA family outer membrane protein [Sphaerotilus sp.]MDZ7858178.1 BamA/TamA family outer membrane protein [Sphaerotilus sp.]